MRSITKDEKSLFKRLIREGKSISHIIHLNHNHLGVPPDDYITFFGMRAYDILMGILVSIRREHFENEWMGV